MATVFQTPKRAQLCTYRFKNLRFISVLGDTVTIVCDFAVLSICCSFHRSERNVNAFSSSSSSSLLSFFLNTFQRISLLFQHSYSVAGYERNRSRRTFKRVKKSRKNINPGQESYFRWQRTRIIVKTRSNIRSRGRFLWQTLARLYQQHIS